MAILVTKDRRTKQSYGRASILSLSCSPTAILVALSWAQQAVLLCNQDSLGRTCKQSHYGEHPLVALSKQSYDGSIA